MATRVRSFSKINLGLAVGPGRADGFHALTTVYQTLRLHDVVTVGARRAESTVIRLTADHPAVPRTATGNAERNTAYRMVAWALERLRITAEVEVGIAKRLPVQGGMGAGSANAVAALLGLERELGVALPGPERLALAAAVGSDVPLFLLGGTVLGVNRGEQVFPLPETGAPLACVIALPEMGVSTAAAFRELDARWGRRERAEIASDGRSLPAGRLTSGSFPDTLTELSRVYASVWTQDGTENGPSGITPHRSSSYRETTELPELDSGTPPQGNGASFERGRESDLAENPLLALVRTGIENDFEEVVFSQHPPLRSTKRDLMGNGESGSALYASLSGSGSALFGLYGSEADARAAQQRVQAGGTRAILTETLGRREYWQSAFV